MGDIQKKLDELVKQADYFIATPETLQKLKDKGLPIRSVNTTYEQYIDKLFADKRKRSSELINIVPKINSDIANTTIQSLYDELRECFVLGITGAGITLSIILLELSLKYSVFNRRKEDDPNSDWDHVEQLDFKGAVSELRIKKIISKKEKQDLDEFNDNIRNPYIHYNIKKLVRDMIADNIPSLDIETGEVTVHRNVRAAEMPHMWFSAKKQLDKEMVNMITTFCVIWTNKLLNPNLSKRLKL